MKCRWDRRPYSPAFKRHRLWEGQTHVRISTLPLSSFGTLNKSCHLSGPQNSSSINLGDFLLMHRKGVMC